MIHSMPSDWVAIALGVARDAKKQQGWTKSTSPLIVVALMTSLKVWAADSFPDNPEPTDCELRELWNLIKKDI